MTKPCVFAAALYVFAAPLAAQMVPGPLRNQYPPALTTVALANADSLGLSAGQRRTIQLRAERLEQAVAPLRNQIAGLRDGRDVRTLSQPDRHAVMVAARTMREAVLATIDSANADVRAALTAAQMQRLDGLAAAACPGCGAGCPGCMNAARADSGRGMHRGGGSGGMRDMRGMRGMQGTQGTQGMRGGRMGPRR